MPPGRSGTAVTAAQGEGQRGKGPGAEEERTSATEGAALQARDRQEGQEEWLQETRRPA